MIPDIDSVPVVLSKTVFLDLVRLLRKNEEILSPQLGELARDFERKVYEFLTIDEAEEFFK